MRRAIALATQNVTSGAGGPFAAVVVRQGQIVGEGVNTVTAAHDPTAHGEVGLGTLLIVFRMRETIW
jgi:guanine deaminase